jgi:hypothetical protein
MGGDPPRLGDTISYMASEVRPAVERQPGSLGTSLFIDPASGAMGFESFWASHGSLVQSEEVIAAGVREAARRTGGTATRERYEVVLFEREAPWRGGQGVRVTLVSVEPSKAEDAVAPMSAESSKLLNVEDAVAWYGDTAVPCSRIPAVSVPPCCTPTGPRAVCSARRYGRIRMRWPPAGARPRRARPPLRRPCTA